MTHHSQWQRRQFNHNRNRFHNGSCLATATSYRATILILHHTLIRLNLPVRRRRIRRLTTRIDSVPVPIETGVSVGVTLTAEQIAKHSAQVGNVGFGLKFEAATIGKVLSKLAWASLAKSRNCYALLFLHNELVLFGRALCLEPLPG